ncbi:L-amino acid N-acyltransferase YncA [Brevibacterium sanguinis]|uniref:L-amino acid N-acyltransferase YncA n=2 Tax=Brevibacterium TaxID=1696 RepID=A0A366IN12_9MICO|nr:MULTISPECIES: GNAT family N-acetyltransferase [Brevibacterium]RBP68128.1 L-amino acid N-acyltransferase YncA [Brevibacterium sanguinis]RBP74455.1 L-amino acid N-acyltransferase YncA [Brevibacterium celere]
MTTPAFSDRVHTTWLDPFSHLRPVVSGESLVVAVDPQHGEGRRCRLLQLVSGDLFVTLSEELAEELAPTLGEQMSATEFLDALGAVGVDADDADVEEVFYLSADEEDRILTEAGAASDARESDESDAEAGAASDARESDESDAEADAATDPRESDESDAGADGSDPGAAVTIRPLTAEDAEAFAAFQSANSADDLDEAFVELDHWEVVGAFADDGELVAVATAYPWRAHPVADIGVLTSPDHRGRKLGSAVVSDLSRRVLERGFSPQYRCERGNDASRATAASAGFVHFATLSVVR